MFYGMPIHIIRDVALTIRSFYKRINDFMRYRQATRDMNARYPDATADEVAREDVCIICREDMRPWREPPAQGGQPAGVIGTNAATLSPIDERLRPKKLPCGHILHFACLRSWLERQQNCPTCRRPVLVSNTLVRSQGANILNQDARAQINLEQPPGPGVGHGDVQQPLVAQNVFQFGPFRLAFGARHAGQGFAQQGEARQPQPNQQAPIVPVGDIQRLGNAFGFLRQAPANQRTVPNFGQTNVSLQLHQIEQQLIREINELQLQADQLFLVRTLQGELARLRIAHANPRASNDANVPTINQYQPQNVTAQGAHPYFSPQVFSAAQQQQIIGSGHRDLPPGVTIPDGWTLLSLQRLPSGVGFGFPQGNVAHNILSNPQSNFSGGTFPSAPSHSTDSSSSRRASAHQSVRATSEVEDGSSSHVVAASSQNTAPQSSRDSAPPGQIISSAREHTVGAQISRSISHEPSVVASRLPTTNLGGLSEGGQVQTLPTWGSNSKRFNGHQESDPYDHHKNADTAGDELPSDVGPSSSIEDENVQAKGKGKAATVEDDLEDTK